MPETPVRMGIKNTERRSFIISSTPFRKDEETKINKKIAAELEKENRMKIKMEKREMKVKEAEDKRKRQMEKTKNKIKKEKTSPKKVSRKVFKKMKQDKALSKPEIQELFRKIEIKKPNVHKSPVLTEQNKTEIKEVKSNSPAHVRKLFLEGEEVPKTKEFQFDNEKTSTGMCFECAQFINKHREGIKCFVCGKRNFHIDCALKINSVNPDFSCETCII